MDNPRNDALLGLFLSAFFAFVLFGLIPGGVDSPTVYDPGQLPPSAYPTWIATAALLLSALLALASLRKAVRRRDADGKTPFPWRPALRLGLAWTLLLVFWLFIAEIGMLLGCFALYAVYAVLCGERKWARLILIDVCLCAVLYLFFVKIAALPVPLGPLQALIQ